MVSGARYILQDEESATDIDFNFEDQEWVAEYRPPEEVPELNVQVQGQIENQQSISVDQDDGTTISGTIKQSLFIGYEVIEDVESDNVLGFMLTLDVPSGLVPDGSVVVQSVRYRK